MAASVRSSARKRTNQVGLAFGSMYPQDQTGGEKPDKEKPELGEVLFRMSKLFPKLENDLSLRQKLDKVLPLPHLPEPSQVAQLYVDIEELLGKMTIGSMSDQEKYILLSRKLHPKTFSEMRADRHFKRRTETFEELKAALLEKSEEDWLEKNLLQLKRENVHTMQDGSSQPAQKTQTQFPRSSAGKGRGKGGKGKGKGNSDPEKPPDPPKFSVTVNCKWCGRKGHYENKCWDIHPELKPKEFQRKSSGNVKDKLPLRINRPIQMKKIRIQRKEKPKFFLCKE